MMPATFSQLLSGTIGCGTFLSFSFGQETGGAVHCSGMLIASIPNT